MYYARSVLVTVLLEQSDVLLALIHEKIFQARVFECVVHDGYMYLCIVNIVANFEPLLCYDFVYTSFCRRVEMA